MQQQQVLREQQQMPFLAMQLRLRGGGDDDGYDGTQPEEGDSFGSTQQDDSLLLEDDPPRLLQVEDGEAREWLATELPHALGVSLSVGRTASGLSLRDSARQPGTFLVHGEHATITLEHGGYVLRLVGAGMMTHVNEVGYRIISLGHFKYNPGPITLAHGDTLRFGGTPHGVDYNYSKFIFVVDASSAPQPDRSAFPLPVPPPTYPPKPKSALRPMLPPSAPPPPVPPPPRLSASGRPARWQRN